MPAMQSFEKGWALRPSRHLYQPGEVVNAVNMTPEQLGALQTRMGMTLLGTLAGIDVTSYRVVYRVAGGGAPQNFQAGLVGTSLQLYRGFSALLGSCALTTYVNFSGFVDFAETEDITGTEVWSYLAGFIDSADNRPKKVQGLLYRHWGIKAPTLAADATTQIVGGGALSAGTYLYQYIYVRQVGTTVVALSNPSPSASSVAVNANDRISVTDIGNPADPASPDYDPQVTHVHLYRSVVNSTSITLFEQSIVATGTGTLTATSSIADSALGEAIEIDNTPPPVGLFSPAAFTSIAVHKGRIFGVNGVDSTLAFSKRFFVESFPADFTIRQGTAADPFVRVLVWNDNLFVLSRAAVWRLLGDDENTFVLIKTDAPVGTDAPWSVAAGLRGFYYKGYDGLYLHAGGQARNISEARIAPLFHFTPVNGFVPAVVGALAANTNVTMSRHVGGWYHSRYYLSYVTVQGSSPSNTLMYDEITETFYPDSRAPRRFFVDQEADIFVGTFSNGTAMRLENGTTDNGAAIPIIFQSRDDDEGAPLSDKQFVEAAFEINTSNAIVTVQLIPNYSDTPLATLGTLTTASRLSPHLEAVAQQYEALAWGYRLAGSGIITLARIIPLVHIFPQRRQAFDVESTDLGYPGPKHLQSLWLDVEPLGATSVTVTLLAEKVAQTPLVIQLPTRNARELLTVDAVIDPTLFGLRIAADGLFRIWDFRLGWNAQPYERRELTIVPSDLGWPGKKILQWISLDATVVDADPVEVEVECDGVRFQTVTLRTQGRQNTGRVRLPRQASGYLIGARMWSEGRFQTFPGCMLGFSRIGQVGEQQSVGLAPLDTLGYQQTNLLTVK